MSDERDSLTPDARRRRGRDRVLAAALAGGAHVLIGVLLMQALPRPQARLEPDAVAVSLVAAPRIVQAPRPAPEPAPRPAARRPARAASAPRPQAAATAPPRPEQPIPAPEPLPPSLVRTPEPPMELTAAQLVGAVTAGAGAGEGWGAGAGEGGEGAGQGGGRSCDMVRRLQAALRRDGRVQAAVAQAHQAARPGGRALLVWNGDWIQSPGEEGKGLASLRQAIIMEVGFAPSACRAEPMHGLVLISLNDAPGSPGVALGSHDWRWADLLFPGGRGVRR